jgi:phytoene synthase
MRTRSDDADIAVCLDLLRRGSKSFHSASRLLPRRLRGPVAAVYGFCRVADDAVDDAVAQGADPSVNLVALRHRLDAIARGEPIDDPVDRALEVVMRRHSLPRVAFDALLDGFAWDVEGRRYDTLDDLLGYCARVASSVGVAMCVLMDRRDPATLARAADLGAAMQLTNIARDVGQDARDGRIYLPLSWLREAGIAPSELDPAEPDEACRFRPAIGWVVRRLLREAGVLYRRADEGIGQLPRDCRVSIAAASAIYEDIGLWLARADYDSVTARAYTPAWRKAWLAARAIRTIGSPLADPSERPPLDATRFLVEAVARG